MLRGIEVGEQSNFRTAVLLQTLKKEEEMAHLRMVIGYKSTFIDRSDPKDIELFNSLLDDYNDLRYPGSAKKRKDSMKKKIESVKDMSNIDLSKVKFKGGPNPLADSVSELSNSKDKEGIVKII